MNLLEYELPLSRHTQTVRQNRTVYAPYILLNFYILHVRHNRTKLQ